MNFSSQMPMFSEEPEEDFSDDLIILDSETSLDEAIGIYVDALTQSGSSIYTVKAFRSDLNLLGKWIGTWTAIGEISTRDLNQFLYWMLNERDKPCSPKTYARRVTTLKHFFSWLRERDVISEDPSIPIIQKTVSSPLPTVLTDNEVKRLLKATEKMRDSRSNPDARPHLLVSLLLQTGIKKAECMNLQPEDVISQGMDEYPLLWIRYDTPRMRYKERRILLEPEWQDTLQEYMIQRQPKKAIFDCTARNLEYVLRDVANASKVARKKVSFETLRWTCALRDFREGMEEETLRNKLGLSRISWRDTHKRLQKLKDKIEKK